MAPLQSLRLYWLVVSLSMCFAGCSTLPAPSGTQSVAVPADATSELGKLARASLVPGASSAVRPLAQASYALDARISLARHAAHTLDLQYYIVEDDAVGRTLLRALRDAAARGVRVRLLVDDLYTSQSGPLLRDLSSYPRVEVRLFNPFPGGRSSTFGRFAASLLDFKRIDHRMHNKLFIADGAFAIAGGRNIGDSYFRHSRAGNFIDFDVLLLGDVVPSLAASFDAFWNSPRSYPLAVFEPAVGGLTEMRRRLDDSATEDSAVPLPSEGAADMLGYPVLSDELASGNGMHRLSPAQVRVFSDSPDKVGARDGLAGSVTASYLDALDAARERVVVVSPYFVPGERGLAAIRAARARGVRVTVITNAMDANDEPFAASAYARYRKRLLELDVELYEESAQRMRKEAIFNDRLGLGIDRSHAKLTLIDDRALFVGSMNLDFRSARLNTELGLLIDSPVLAGQTAALVTHLCELGCYRVRQSAHGLEWVSKQADGRESVSDSEPELDAWTRLKLRLLSPLVPDELL